MINYLIFTISATLGAGLYIFMHAEQRDRMVWSGWLLLTVALLGLLSLCWQGVMGTSDSGVFEGIWGVIWLSIAAATLYCGVSCVLAIETRDNLLWSAGVILGLAMLMFFVRNWIPGTTLFIFSLAVFLYLLPGGMTNSVPKTATEIPRIWHETFLSVLAGVLFCYCGLTVIHRTAETRFSDDVTGRQALPRPTLIESIQQQSHQKMLDHPQGEHIANAWLQPKLLVRIAALCCLLLSLGIAAFWLHTVAVLTNPTQPNTTTNG